MSFLFDQYEQGRFEIAVEERRVSGGCGVQQLIGHFGPGSFREPETPDFLFQTLICETPSQAICDFGSGKFDLRLSQGDSILNPVDADRHYLASLPASLLVTSVPKHLMEDLTETISGTSVLDFGKLHATPLRDPAVFNVLRRIWDESVSGRPNGTLYADGATYALISLLLAHAGIRPQELVPRPVSASARIKRAVELMHDSIGEDLELADLADVAAMSLSSFHRAFRTEIGSSPWRYFQGIRIARAKLLLSNTRKSVTEIALEVGYATPQRFATVFREVTGFTPSGWRAKGNLRIHLGQESVPAK